MRILRLNYPKTYGICFFEITNIYFDLYAIWLNDNPLFRFSYSHDYDERLFWFYFLKFKIFLAIPDKNGLKRNLELKKLKEEVFKK